jgi:transposase InsO family protein
MPAVRASFVASARTYGARRIWRDVLEAGFSSGLHKIERLMRAQALRARFDEELSRAPSRALPRRIR